MSRCFAPRNDPRYGKKPFFDSFKRPAGAGRLEYRSGLSDGVALQHGAGQEWEGLRQVGVIV